MDNPPQPPPPSSTTITLHNLTTQATLNQDAWSRPSKPQPLHLSLHLSLPPTTTSTDTLTNTVNYSTLAKAITTLTQYQTFSSLAAVTSKIAYAATAWPGRRLRLEVRAPKALVRGEGLERVVWLDRPWGVGRSNPLEDSGGDEAVVGREVGMPWKVLKHEYVLPSLRLACVIGVNPHERVERQDVVFKIRFFFEGGGVPRLPSSTPPSLKERGGVRAGEDEIPWQVLVRRLAELIEATSFQTVEALAGHVADWLLGEEVVKDGLGVGLAEHAMGVSGAEIGKDSEAARDATGMNGLEGLQGVSVAVEKPAALAFVEGAGVEVVRIKVHGKGKLDGRKVEEHFIQ